MVYKNGRERFLALRIKEIRESDMRIQLPHFNGLFESALARGIARKPYGLSKAMRVYFGVDILSNSPTRPFDFRSL